MVTHGEKGASIYTEGQNSEIPAVAPEHRRSHRGWRCLPGRFSARLPAGNELETCGQMGALAATYCLEQRGTQDHSYTPDEFVARYRRL